MVAVLVHSGFLNPLVVTVSSTLHKRGRIGARTPERSEAARAKIAAALAARDDTLDVLVNNAGAWFTDRRLSPEGYELTFATNVVAGDRRHHVDNSGVAGCTQVRPVQAGTHDAHLGLATRLADGGQKRQHCRAGLRAHRRSPQRGRSQGAGRHLAAIIHALG
jgi:NAD(P)-dependent dehydrogenase (short-subunit alcohol dehydrogenase family)